MKNTQALRMTSDTFFDRVNRGLLLHGIIYEVFDPETDTTILYEAVGNSSYIILDEVLVSSSASYPSGGSGGTSISEDTTYTYPGVFASFDEFVTLSNNLNVLGDTVATFYVDEQALGYDGVTSVVLTQTVPFTYNPSRPKMRYVTNMRAGFGIDDVPHDHFNVTGHTTAARANDMIQHNLKARALFPVTVEFDIVGGEAPFAMSGAGFKEIEGFHYWNIGSSGIGYDTGRKEPSTGAGHNTKFGWFSMMGATSSQIRQTYGGAFSTTLTTRIILAGGTTGWQNQYSSATGYAEGMIIVSARQYGIRGKQAGHMYLGGSHHGSYIGGCGLSAVSITGVCVLNATGATIEYNKSGVVGADNSYISLKGATVRHNDGPQVRVDNNTFANCTGAAIYKGTGTTVLQDVYTVFGGKADTTGVLSATAAATGGSEVTTFNAGPNIEGQDYMGSTTLESRPSLTSAVSSSVLVSDVTLNWTAGNSIHAKDVTIHRGPNTVFNQATLVGTASSTQGESATWTDTGVPSGTYYYFVTQRAERGTPASASRRAGPVTVV